MCPAVDHWIEANTTFGNSEKIGTSAFEVVWQLDPLHHETPPGLQLLSHLVRQLQVLLESFHPVTMRGHKLQWMYVLSASFASHANFQGKTNSSSSFGADMNLQLLSRKTDAPPKIKFVRRNSRTAVPNHERFCRERRAASRVMGKKLQDRMHRRPGHLQRKAWPHPFRVKPLLLCTLSQITTVRHMSYWFRMVGFGFDACI